MRIPEGSVIFVGFVVAVVGLALLSSRFGVDSRVDAWSEELRRGLDWSA